MAYQKLGNTLDKPQKKSTQNGLLIAIRFFLTSHVKFFLSLVLCILMLLSPFSFKLSSSRRQKSEYSARNQTYP